MSKDLKMNRRDFLAAMGLAVEEAHSVSQTNSTCAMRILFSLHKRQKL